MSEERTVFQRIIAGELPCDKVFENERIIAFKDIAPVAPVHLLVVSKKVYPSLQHIPAAELSILAEMMGVVQKLAVEYKVQDGYRCITNIGPDSGQEVRHLHFHVIGGRRLGALA
ncbi:MAG: histidine triad nucleotide-binding protein [Chlamydiia bacterium]|nr:histidine triad nucleotide-binding protein [Chlamydiia bacterium]